MRWTYRFDDVIYHFTLSGCWWRRISTRPKITGNATYNNHINYVKLKILQQASIYFSSYHHKWAPPSEFVSSSIPSWQILTAHAQPFREAMDLAFCLKVPLDSLLIWASSGGSGETARMRRLAWTFAARMGDKYQIRLTRPKLYFHRWVSVLIARIEFNYSDVVQCRYFSHSEILVPFHIEEGALECQVPIKFSEKTTTKQQQQQQRKKKISPLRTFKIAQSPNKSDHAISV